LIRRKFLDDIERCKYIDVYSNDEEYQYIVKLIKKDLKENAY